MNVVVEGWWIVMEWSEKFVARSGWHGDSDALAAFSEGSWTEIKKLSDISRAPVRFKSGLL